MKEKVLILGLALALVIVCVQWGKGKTTSSSSASNGDDVYTNIMTRSSVRSYQDKPVEKDKIEKLLRAGMAAPSAMNKQPWHFVVVTDKKELADIAEATPNASMAKDAPLAIIVCGDLTKAADGDAQQFWIQDCSAVSENILLAAHGMGLGAVWTGTYPSEERCEAIRKIVGLPKTMVPLNTIVIGYPDGEAQPKDKWNTENISYNHYGNKAASDNNSNATSESKDEFKAFDVNEDFHANPFKFFKGDGLLIAAGDKNGFNEMTIGWGAVGNLWAPNNATMTVYVAQGRYTHQFMEKTKYFTGMVFDDAHKDILRYMGTHSGRDGDKVKALGLHTLYTKNGTPYFAEASEVYECRMAYHTTFDPKNFESDLPKNFYAHFNAGYHTEYIGEIVGAWRK